MARLLITTFNAPGESTAAPLMLRKSIAPLVADSLDDANPNDADLNGKSLWEGWPTELNEVSRYVPKALPLKYVASDALSPLRDARILAFMRWTTGWPDMYEKQQALLSKWIPKLFERPVHLWAIGGHHAGQSLETGGRYHAMVWFHDIRDTDFWPINGLGLTFNGELEFFGYKPLTRTRLTIPLPKARAAFKDVRMMMIFGCNGVPGKNPNEEEPMSRAWQDWLSDAGRRPLILGWHKTKNMPPDRQPKGKERFATDLFAKKLQTLADKLHPGSADPFLDMLSTTTGARQVAQCWGAACYEAFHDAKQGTKPSRILWTDCGALAPDTEVWHANVKKYRGVQTDPPFNLADEANLPLIRRGK